MAKKKKSAPPEAPVLNSGQTITNTTSGVMKSMPTQIGQGNTATRTEETIGTLDWILTDGAVFIDPAARAEITATANALNKVLAPLTKTSATLTTKITTAQTTINTLEAKVADGETLTRAEQNKLNAARGVIEKNQPKLDEARANIEAQSKPLQDLYDRVQATSPKATDLITEKFPEAAATLAAAKPLLANMGQLGASGTALQTALNQGFTPNQIIGQSVNAAQMGPIADVTAQRTAATQMDPIANVTARQTAALQMDPIANVTAQRTAATQMGPIADVRAQQTTAAQMGALPTVSASQVGQNVMGNVGSVRGSQIGAESVGAGLLGQALMDEAVNRVRLQGRLSAQDERDVTQATRAGMAARGMATGAGALGAELLNRDRYTRQRAFEDLRFAQGIQDQDTLRQTNNADRRLTADAANQKTAIEAEIANLTTRFNEAKANQDTATQREIANQVADLRAKEANLDAIIRRDTVNVTETNRTSMANADRSLTADQSNQTTELNRGQANMIESNRVNIAGDDRVLTADTANQTTAFNRGQANMIESNRVAIAGDDRVLAADQGNQTTELNRGQANMRETNLVGISNADRGLNASIADEEARRLGTQTNIGMLGDSYALDKGTNQDKLNAVMMEGGLASAANPTNMLMGIYTSGQPGGSQSAGPATSAGIAAGELEAGNAWNTHNSNMWSWGQQNFGNYGNLGSSYFTGSAMGDALVSEGVGLVTDLAGGALAKSDRRMKKDIKPMGTAGGILGLPAYQYRYKNDPSNRKRVGLMAQDVKRVLPQAVREITVDGRKRLGIKPQVIGQALARELTAQAR